MADRSRKKSRPQLQKGRAGTSQHRRALIGHTIAGTDAEGEWQAAVNGALRRLPAKDRTLFFRKYYYLQSTAQIASEMGMTERAVEGKLYRIKKRLRRLLGGEGYAGS